MHCCCSVSTIHMLGVNKNTIQLLIFITEYAFHSVFIFLCDFQSEVNRDVSGSFSPLKGVVCKLLCLSDHESSWGMLLRNHDDPRIFGGSHGSRGGEPDDCSDAKRRSWRQLRPARNMRKLRCARRLRVLRGQSVERANGQDKEKPVSHSRTCDRE